MKHGNKKVDQLDFVLFLSLFFCFVSRRDAQIIIINPCGDREAFILLFFLVLHPAVWENIMVGGSLCANSPRTIMQSYSWLDDDGDDCPKNSGGKGTKPKNGEENFPLQQRENMPQTTKVHLRRDFCCGCVFSSVGNALPFFFCVTEGSALKLSQN